MRDIHKSGYAQAIPGVNKLDDEVKFTSAETRLGDGLPVPDRLLCDAASAHQRARQTRAWFESAESAGEKGVAEAFRRRDAKVRQWRAILNAEVDSLAKEIEDVTNGEMDVGRRRGYLSEVGEATEMTFEFRKRIPDKQPDDVIDRLLEEEKMATRQAEEVGRQCSKDLEDCRRRLESARRGLMSEVEAKSLTLNISRRCQNSQTILSFPHRPSDHPSDQLYHPHTEVDWERHLEAKLRDATELRHESSASRLRAVSAMEDGLAAVADKWRAATKGLEEEVARDERTLHNIRKTLEELGQEILWSSQRVSQLLDQLRLEERGKQLQLWRLQTLTYRPGHDHIRDEPARRCDGELSAAEKRGAFAASGVDVSRDLLARLRDEKRRQAETLDKTTRKLFVERENCLGLRRTVRVEGRGYGSAP